MHRALVQPLTLGVATAAVLAGVPLALAAEGAGFAEDEPMDEFALLEDASVEAVGLVPWVVQPVFLMDNVMLVLARIGWKIPASGGREIEARVKLFLPILFSPPYFRYREEGGGVTPGGVQYGGEELRRVVSGYLQGSF